MNKFPEDSISLSNIFSDPPIQQLHLDEDRGDVHMLRLDLIQSWASGNKFFKLKKHFEHALSQGMQCLVSKGGMASNHLHAFADACHYFKRKCVCIIRSYGDDPLNPTIKHLKEKNAELIFLEPKEYDSFDEERSGELFPGAYFIPEVDHFQQLLA
jgi:1-aminocyclopropane-1-carboxylate deaminase